MVGLLVPLLVRGVLAPIPYPPPSPPAAGVYSANSSPVPPPSFFVASLGMHY